MSRLGRRVYWLSGALISLGGVALARLVAPQLPEALQGAAFVAGVTIAIVGLFVAALGRGRG